jgi:hypothetical protein
MSWSYISSPPSAFMAYSGTALIVLKHFFFHCVYDFFRSTVFSCHSTCWTVNKEIIFHLIKYYVMTVDNVAKSRKGDC